MIPIGSWAAAAEVAAVSHVVYLDTPVSRVLSLVPRRYDDLWTGAKGFYKVEPIVADGGEVVLVRAAHHPDRGDAPGLDELGYHCRDYFLAQWDRFRDHPRGELAHSTHLYGAGTFDPVHGEHQRVQVNLADRHPRGRGPPSEPRLPRPRDGRPRGLGGRPGRARRARRR